MNEKRRSGWIFLFLLLGFIAVLVKAVLFQVSPDPRLQNFAKSKKQLSKTKVEDELITARGTIQDQTGKDLALSIIVRSFFANPKVIKDPLKAARKLGPVLGMSTASLRRLLSQDRHFVWLKREVDDQLANRIEALQIEGIYSKKESKRVYPQGELGRVVLGTAGFDGVGLEGIEKSFDSYLRSSDQAAGATGLRDALGRVLLFEDFKREWFESATVQTTLDLRIQRILEDELKASLKEKRALSAQGIVVNPHTGEILAMASLEGSRPDRNPSRNRLISDVFEPGSTFKIFLAAAAVEKLKMTANTQIYAEKGIFRVGSRTIREFHGKKYEWLTLSELLEVSSNIASAKVGLKLGNKDFGEFLARLGFMSKTGIDLPGEAESLVRNPKDWKPIELANISFGQGIAVTPIQIVRALSAIANGGYLVRPHLVKAVLSSQPQPKILYQAREEREEVLDPEIARKLSSMLTTTVNPEGTGAAAAIDGYAVAGKTGTSQKLEEKKDSRGRTIRTYSMTKSIASFAGFVPAYDPKLLAYIIIDEPEGRASGGAVAAPVFRRVASRALSVLGIQEKSRDEAPEKLRRRGPGEYVGLSFQEVLREIRKLPESQRAKIDLVGYGTAVEEELDEDDRLIIKFR